MCEKFDIKSASWEELAVYIKQLGEPAFRAKQIYEWMHVKHVTGIDDMTNLSKSLRERLKEQCSFTVLTPVDVQISRQDGTRKYLFALADGNVIESVLMRYKHGNSVCISSQAGCRMGCRFCASTLDGLERNLTPAEMLEQIYRIGCDIGERISNVVVMGSGEPLDNYENLLKFIRMLTDERGLHISQRNVTVSTCGLVERIRELADEKLAITLALSLHASSQEKRRELMPVANKYELEDVLDACDYYFAQTGRRMTYEYSLVGGVNDTDEDLAGLVRMLKGRNCHINLIPVNPIKERSYVQSDRSRVESFQKKLEQQGINATIRREMGRDIDGACGQLRKKHMDEKIITENSALETY
jgi:23S rRNA (adenine2503-C2)-methyltransferase